MTNRLCKKLLIAAMLVFQQPAIAEDIDLFLGAPSASAELPNVLIVIDNTANWNTAFTAEMEALASTVAGLDPNQFRLGFMMYTETGSGNANPDGAYVRAAVRTMSAANKTLYQNLVNSFHVLNDKSNNGKLGLTMSEVDRYFAGTTAYAGANKKKRDYSGNSISGLNASNAVYSLPGNALASSTATTYTSPASTSGCQKNFVIFLSNGKSNANSSDNTTAQSQLSAVGGTTTLVPLSPSGYQDDVADEWARYLAKKSSRPVVTYVIDVVPTVAGQYSLDYKELLKSMANQGTGEYFDVGSADAPDVGAKILAAFAKIFSDIQAVNSVFASVSLPASVGTQGIYLNQIYIGMFRPDKNAKPRWPGNLKQYKLGFDSNDTDKTELRLVYDLADNDTNNDNDTSAISSSGSGFIASCARSYWTDPTVDSYWINNPQGDCNPATIGSTATAAELKASNYPDGQIVEKGAQGGKLRAMTPGTTNSSTTRTVYTCSPTFASCSGAGSPNTPISLDSFSTGNANITQALLDSATGATNRDTLINWARGQDLNNEDGDATTATTVMRQSVHGDVIHSRPVAINYGGDDLIDRQVVVYYSSNDGMLHAINGNRFGNIPAATPGDEVTPGSELWSFVPPEFYGKIKRIYDNTPIVTFPSGVPGPNAKPYGMDGPITAFQGTILASQKTFIYTAMRRGGRALYAFDVTTPASPTLKWKKGCPEQVGDTDCTAGFDGIGQTWSQSTVMKAAGYGSGASPMLIMGGGYDPCEDFDAGVAGGANHNCTGATKGNKIYVLDADTGDLLRTLDTDRAVAGGITIVPNTSAPADSDGYQPALYAYAADLGGNVYRIDIGSTAPSAWTITKIASLGCDTTTACTANRKFMFAPDVVAVPGVQTTYSILIGSGDREKPLLDYAATAAVTNYFFMIQDVPTDSGWPASKNALTLCGANIICLDLLTPIGVPDPTDQTAPTDTELNSKKGWYLGLADTEQVVTSAITISNVVTFSTHKPEVYDAASCKSGLGIATNYNVFYRNASGAKSVDGSPYRSGTIAGGGLTQSPVGGQVKLDDGSVVPFLFGGDEDSGLEGGSPSGTVTWTQPKSRVYWYIEQ